MLDTLPSHAPRAGPDATRRPSPWLVELLDVIRLRRWTLAGVAIAVGLAGCVVAVLLPEVLPPRPLAGAGVGIAGYLLGVAAAIAVDAADPVVRGRRHVEATGAVMAAAITGYAPAPEFVAWVERLVVDHKGLRIAITATGSDSPGSGQLADELGVALARHDRHVLVTNLEKANEEWPGASEVCGGEVTLSEVVEFHPSLPLARLGPGRDRARALSEFTMLASSLPTDVDVLVVALPGLGSVGALPALAAVDRALLLATANVTSRVELLAALESVDEIRMPTDVVLVQGLTGTEPGMSNADPIDLWTQAMTLLEDPGDGWIGEMVTIVAPPSKEGAGATQLRAANGWGARQVSNGLHQVESQAVPATADSTGGFAEPLEWERSPASPGTARSSGDAALPLMSPPAVDPSKGDVMWEPDPREVAAAGHPANWRYSDRDGRDGSSDAPTPPGARLNGPDTELRLSDWLNDLGEDESPEQAGGRQR